MVHGASDLVESSVKFVSLEFVVSGPALHSLLGMAENPEGTRTKKTQGRQERHTRRLIVRDGEIGKYVTARLSERLQRSMLSLCLIFISYRPNARFYIRSLHKF